MVSATIENANPALISLEPRQVMLGKQKNDSDLKTVEMQLVEEKKEKRRKKKMKKEMGPLLLQSIARYLETIGFSETLSALRSEGSLHKIGAEKVHSLDLEAVCRQYMDTSEYPEEANSKNLKELDIADQLKDVITQEDVQPVSKKKKKSNVSDANIEVKDNLSNGARDELYIENDKEKNEAESKKSKSDIESSNCNILLEESHVKSKGKKKKNESVSDSVVEDAKQVASETSQGAAEKTDQECHLDEMSKKSKRKKVKDKLSDSALPEKAQHDGSETLQEVIKDKSKDVLLPDTVAETAPVEISLDEAKSKDKKKKKKKKEKEKEDSNLTDSRKEGFLVSEENVVADEKKGSKKRKRSTSEETDSRVDDEIAKGSAPSKIDGSKENKEKEHQLPNDVQECNGHLNLGKKRKSEIRDDGSNKCLNKQHEEDSRKVGGLADVNPPDRSRRDAATPKTTKKELNGSAEPKAVNSFQRIKIDQVKFADERLQDNSYWAKSGADIGYGAKAQEVLGQVKGRDFRHEKTKKKRGSYRGGQIDLQSHSIKFNYSDGDDE